MRSYLIKPTNTCEIRFAAAMNELSPCCRYMKLYTYYKCLNKLSYHRFTELTLKLHKSYHLSHSNTAAYSGSKILNLDAQS